MICSMIKNETKRLVMLFIFSSIYVTSDAVNHPSPRHGQELTRHSDHLQLLQRNLNLEILYKCTGCAKVETWNQCRRAFELCKNRPQSFPIDIDPALLSLTTVVIASCSRVTNIEDNNSILCNGMKAIQECRSRYKCLLLNDLSVTILGVSVSLAEEVQKLENENNKRDIITRKELYQEGSGMNDYKEEFQDSEPIIHNSVRTKSVYSPRKQISPPTVQQLNTAAIVESVTIDVPTSTGCGGRSLLSNTDSRRVDITHGVQSLTGSIKTVRSLTPSRLCPGPIQGPRRIPVAVHINIGDTHLPRSEIVDRAIRKLKTRPGFKNIFSNNVQVKSVNENGARFRYIVKFVVFF